MSCGAKLTYILHTSRTARGHRRNGRHSPWSCRKSHPPARETTHYTPPDEVVDVRRAASCTRPVPQPRGTCAPPRTPGVTEGRVRGATAIGADSVRLTTDDVPSTDRMVPTRDGSDAIPLFRPHSPPLPGRFTGPLLRDAAVPKARAQLTRPMEGSSCGTPGRCSACDIA